MAIKPLHESITKDVLVGRFHFTAEASEIAARANKQVDDKQGSNAEETNLHAMIGYLPPSSAVARLQTNREATEAVRALLEGKKNAVVQEVVQGRKKTAERQKAMTEGRVQDATRAGEEARQCFLRALQRLGEGLHTCQDWAFHNFEPWPYGGIVDAIRQAPNYMLMHGIRDLGAVSRLDVATTDRSRARFDVEWACPVSFACSVEHNLFVGVRGFGELLPPPGSTDPFGAARTPGHPGMDQTPLGWGGMLTLTIGGAPGSARPAPRLAVDPVAERRETPYSREITAGPAARVTAYNESVAFVSDVEGRVKSHRDAGSSGWDSVANYR